MSQFFDEYYAHVEERAKEGIPPLALSKEQTEEVIGLLKTPPVGKEDELVDLIEHRVNPGVDPAAQVKAEFLFKVAHGEESTPLITPERAVELEFGTGQADCTIGTQRQPRRREELAGLRGELVVDQRMHVRRRFCGKSEQRKQRNDGCGAHGLTPP